MRLGPHQIAAAQTTRAARRGRSALDWLLCVVPQPLKVAFVRLALAQARAGLGTGLIDFGVRRAYAAFNRRDWEFNTILMDDERYVFESADDSPLLPDTGQSAPGVAGYLAVQAEWQGAWTQLECSSEGTIYVGGSRLLSLMRFMLRGSGSGMAMEIRAAAAMDLANGGLGRHTVYWDRDAAARELGVALPTP